MTPAAREVLVESKGGRLRAASLADGELIEFVTERVRAPAAPGSIYVGRVLGRAPALRATFVDIGLERPALLDVRDDMPHEGTTLPVQVIEPAFGDKGARVSRRLAVEGRYTVLLPGGKGVGVSSRIGGAQRRRQLQEAAVPLKRPGEGLIIRAAAEGIDADALTADIARLRAVWSEVQAALPTAKPPACLFDNGDGLVRLLRRMIAADVPGFTFDDPLLARRARATAERLLGVALDVQVESQAGVLFDRHGIGDVLASLESPVLRLPSGGRLAIEQTAAVTAIDVDTADATALGAEAPLRTDLEAATEIGRQVRLRDLGGVIVIDFVRLTARGQRGQVEAALRRAVAVDRVAVQLLGWTAAGLFEMIRPRGRAVAAFD